MNPWNEVNRNSTPWNFYIDMNCCLNNQDLQLF